MLEGYENGYPQDCGTPYEAAYRQQVPGMAYVPMQQWSTPMPIETGFCAGTIFYDLDKPFQP